MDFKPQIQFRPTKPDFPDTDFMLEMLKFRVEQLKRKEDEMTESVDE